MCVCVCVRVCAIQYDNILFLRLYVRIFVDFVKHVAVTLLGEIQRYRNDHYYYYYISRTR